MSNRRPICTRLAKRLWRKLHTQARSCRHDIYKVLAPLGQVEHVDLSQQISNLPRTDIAQDNTCDFYSVDGTTRSDIWLAGLWALCNNVSISQVHQRQHLASARPILYAIESAIIHLTPYKLTVCLQKHVLAFYRTVLRGARNQPPEQRTSVEAFARSELERFLEASLHLCLAS